MRLVVDTNILVSFFRSNPVNDIISKSRYINLQLFSPEYAIEELKKNETDVLKYSSLNQKQFNEELVKLSTFIKIIPNKSFKEFEEKTKQISPHDKDAPVFALALKLNCAIWSNELAFKKQSKIEVLSTMDIIELLG